MVQIVDHRLLFTVPGQDIEISAQARSEVFFVLHKNEDTWIFMKFLWVHCTLKGCFKQKLDFMAIQEHRWKCCRRHKRVLKRPVSIFIQWSKQKKARRSWNSCQQQTRSLHHEARKGQQQNSLHYSELRFHQQRRNVGYPCALQHSF